MYQLYHSITFCWDSLGEPLFSFPWDWLKLWSACSADGKVLSLGSLSGIHLPWSHLVFQSKCNPLRIQYKEQSDLLGRLQIHRSLPGTDSLWRYHGSFTWTPGGTSHSISFLYAFPWLDWPWILISIYPLLFNHLLATEKSRLLPVAQITLTALIEIHLWKVQKRLKKAQVVYFSNPPNFKGKLSHTCAPALCICPSAHRGWGWKVGSLCNYLVSSLTLFPSPSLEGFSSLEMWQGWKGAGDG